MAEAPRDGAVRVLRVIARLNMGGPALHVAYLSAGLADRGYDTTLVAGTRMRNRLACIDKYIDTQGLSSAVTPATEPAPQTTCVVSWVTIAFTPASAFAFDTSIDVMRACGCGLRSTRA